MAVAQTLIAYTNSKNKKGWNASCMIHNVDDVASIEKVEGPCTQFEMGGCSTIHTIVCAMSMQHM